MKLNPLLNILILINMLVCMIIVFFGMPFVFCSSLTNYNKPLITLGALGVVILGIISFITSYRNIGEEKVATVEFYTILLGLICFTITIMLFGTKII